ncbi:hypothetical protein IEQ34_021613 [Dendrobium chrysotoxum]|uniref:Retrotransposon gag domain-containing protein n=1 Tax=Dendrobium chrysotoxum TaxID=161865 RepID=A0AAV7G410_DENCH|nr:hypothetical protein IEQ34_021613 [Dendrobium chrysotoxum]
MHEAFIKLEQGWKIVMQYEAEFTVLARYAPHIQEFFELVKQAKLIEINLVVLTSRHDESSRYDVSKRTTRDEVSMDRDNAGAIGSSKLGIHSQRNKFLRDFRKSIVREDFDSLPYLESEKDDGSLSHLEDKKDDGSLPHLEGEKDDGSLPYLNGEKDDGSLPHRG